METLIAYMSEESCHLFSVMRGKEWPIYVNCFKNLVLSCFPEKRERAQILMFAITK